MAICTPFDEHPVDIEDSFYDDEKIKKDNEDRKTYLTYWVDWFTRPIY